MCFPFSTKNGTDRPKFAVFLLKRMKIRKSMEFLSVLASPDVNKQICGSAFISSHGRAEKGHQTAKVIKQHLEGLVGKK